MVVDLFGGFSEYVVLGGFEDWQDTDIRSHSVGFMRNGSMLF